MGDWDFYCALCAASFTTVHFEEFEEFRHLADLFFWVLKLQVVDQNPQANGLSCCYISGEGECDYYGFAKCKPSNDPNCPNPDVGSETFDVSTYYNYATMQEGAVPVHKNCLEIFKKALALEKGVSFLEIDSIELDPDILFSTMRQKRQSIGLRCLDVDYFELNMYKSDQYFIYSPESMPYIMDPMNIPTMKDYISNMPIATPKTNTSATASHSLLSDDPFSILPPEILTEILMILPTESFTRLMIVSPATRQIQLTPSFWRKRVELQMPWSWDVIIHAAQTDKTYDWEKIYHDLDRLSMPGAKVFDSLGFANRRRIYNVCQQLIPIYMRLETEARATLPDGDSNFEMLRTAKCHHFVSVSMPLVSAFTPTNTFMLPRWSDIAHERKTLEISWNSSGVLARISLTVRDIRSAVEASEIGAIVGLTTETLVIQEGDWIDGFMFFMSAPEPKIIGVTIRTLRSPHATFGSTEGIGLRLMSVDEGNVFVGLKAVATTDYISRLGILECPLPTSVKLPMSPPKVNAATRKLIWKNQLPPPSVRALPYQLGYNNYGEESTESGQVMETLLFGSSETQLNKLTGIAVSADFLGFYVYHNEAEPSFIGLSKTKLKHFPIDGSGGERVIKLSLGVGSNPTGLKVLTNRNRQGIFGMLREGSSQVHEYARTNPDEAIAGLYGSFEKLKGYPRFTALGVLCAPSTSSQPPTTTPSPGAWDPTPPPANWRPEGPIYGGSEHFALTYLDLTKPISKISGLLAAPDWYHIIELGGFVVTYVDGTTCYVGIPNDQWNQINDAESASSLDRHKGMSYGFGESDDGVLAHATTAEAVTQNRGGACWDLGSNGARITMITVWAGKYLNGIQFHAVDGRASPRWGKCGQVAAAIITTSANMPMREANLVVHTGAVGVKYYLDSHRDHRNASDARPVGLQALVAF